VADARESGRWRALHPLRGTPHLCVHSAHLGSRRSPPPTMPRFYYGAVSALAWILNHYFYDSLTGSKTAKARSADARSAEKTATASHAETQRAAAGSLRLRVSAAVLI